jgi:hypothetical protein
MNREGNLCKRHKQKGAMKIRFVFMALLYFILRTV